MGLEGTKREVTIIRTCLPLKEASRDVKERFLWVLPI